jgi:methionine biosynthesis protein MetW
LKEYYNTAYFRKPEALFREEDRLKKVLKIMAKHDGGVLLDIGCGNGGITAVLREAMRSKEAYGVEVSPEGVSLANQKGIKAYETDVSNSKLPFKDGFFDVVFCGEVIEHLFDPDFLLKELQRVLKSEGILILTTPNLAAWYNRISLLFGFQPSIAASLEYPEVGKPFKNAFKKKSAGGSEAHIRHFTRRALEQLLIIHNFEILKITGAYYGKPDASSRMSKMMFLFDRFFVHFPSSATDLIVEARKK